MSEHNPDKTRQHVIIAAIAGAVCVFALTSFAQRFLLPASSPVVAASSPQSVPATSTPSAEDIALQQARAEQARQAEAAFEQKQKELDAAAEVVRQQKLQEALNARNSTASDQAKKDQAWENFYKKPKKCENPSDKAAIVECSNHYLREQQRFEKLYADGKL